MVVWKFFSFCSIVVMYWIMVVVLISFSVFRLIKVRELVKVLSRFVMGICVLVRRLFLLVCILISRSSVDLWILGVRFFRICSVVIVVVVGFVLVRLLVRIF